MSAIRREVPENTFGPFVLASNIRASVLAILQDQVVGVVPYIAEITRQNVIAGTVPLPDPNAGSASFRPGIDFDTYDSDSFPLWIVTCEPFDAPERYGGQEYGQWFQVGIAAYTRQDDLDNAIRDSEIYGAAAYFAVGQHRSLGGIGTDTTMVDYPKSEFPDPEGPRNMVRTVLRFNTYVQPVFLGRGGPPAERTPLAPGSNQYADVDVVNVTIQTEDAQVSENATATVDDN